MYRISVFVFLIGLAMGADNCGDQYASSFMCMMDLKSTDEVKLIIEKTKDACKECAPDYPKSCTEEWEAMESCCAELTAKAKLNDDPECAAIVNKTISDVNKCFETEPSDPLADLEMLIAPPMRMHTHEMMMKHMKKGGKSGMKEGGEKKSKEKAGGEKSKEKAKSEDKSKNSTASGSGSSESEEEDEMPGFPHPPKSMHIRKECMKTPEQMKCLKKKLSEGMKDEKFQKAIETLLKKKDECEEKVKRECELTTPELGKCFFTAHKDLFKKIFEKMETCVKGKTGGGSSSDTKSEKKEGEKKDEKKEEKKDEKKDEKKEEKKDEKEEKKEEKGTETPKKGDRRRRR